MDARGFIAVRMRMKPAPAVRLSKMRAPHVRMIEILRALERLGGAGVPVRPDFCVELARRGVLDTILHFTTASGCVAVNPTGIFTVQRAVAEMVELGLVTLGPKRAKRERLVTVTPSGRCTLDDWDDPEADCI